MSTFIVVDNVLLLHCVLVIEARGTYRALSQSRDDVSQSREGLVDILCLVQDCPSSACLADLKEEGQLS